MNTNKQPRIVARLFVVFRVGKSLHTEIIPVDLEFLQHPFFGQLAAEIPLNAAG